MGIVDASALAAGTSLEHWTGQKPKRANSGNSSLDVLPIVEASADISATTKKRSSEGDTSELRRSGHKLPNSLRMVAIHNTPRGHGMTQHHHVPVQNATSNGSSSQAESSQVLPDAFNSLARFAEQLAQEEQAKAAAEGSPSGRHFPNAGRVHSGEPEKNARQVQSSITDLTKLSFVGFGVDWLRFPVYGRSVPSHVLADLKAAKAKAKGSQDPVYFELGGMTWTVVPNSDAKGVNNLPYMLKCAGVTLSLGEGGPGRPVAAVQATGRYCANFHPNELKTELKALVARVGVIAERFGCPTRLDIRGDVSGLHVSRLADAVAKDRVLTRADCDEVLRTHKKVNAVIFGRRGGRVYCRAYDKVLELSKDDDKRAEYLNVNALERLPEVLTRLEYELSSDFFRETWGARSLDQVFDTLGMLVEYLMHDWLRVCVDVNRNNTQRSKTTSWWAWLKSKMIAAAGASGERPKAEALEPDASKLVRQIIGCASSALALVGLVPSNAKDAITLLFQEFLKDFDEVRFKEQFWRKSERLSEFTQLWCGRSASRAALVLQ
jgi:hypothetical protein